MKNARRGAVKNPPRAIRLLDVAGAARLLGVHPNWIRTKVKELPHIKVGRYTRFHPDSLIRWALDREEKPL